MSSVVQPRGQTVLLQALAYRPQLRVEMLALLSSLFFSVFCNNVFWQRLADTGALGQPGGVLTAVSLFVAMTALTTALMCLLLHHRSTKPVLGMLFIATALAVHYMDQYMVYLDPDMLRNILHTDRREASELITTGLVAPLLLYAALPIALLSRVRLKPAPGPRGWLWRGASLLGAVLVAALAIGVSFQNMAALMHNHPNLRHLITPGNYLVSLARVAADDSGESPRQPVGLDARVAPLPVGKPRLLVIVVGETVRAQNWGLNGYERHTTPELARMDVINFSDVTACGSSTEVSVPCMFSPYGRSDYDADRIKHSESLLHVLDHAGIATAWRDNQSGCKGVCEGLPYRSFVHAGDAELCDDGRCLDEVMLNGLQRRIESTPGDLVVALHQLGNHGPSYYRRYPQRLARFDPACTTSELGRCSQRQIVNAYDNAVLYTDHFVAQAIRLLHADDSHDDALIYLSDHGESLGEHGLYLHGMPYAIAPETQTRVPMVMWLSPGFADSRGIDRQCMERVAAQPASHDNLFHSVLGLLQVETAVYDASLDLFAPCDRQ